VKNKQLGFIGLNALAELAAIGFVGYTVMVAVISIAGWELAHYLFAHISFNWN